MDSTVKSRPNHYELLGLSPTATLDEIDQAFARELRLPRAFGSLAEFTIAYETLRDPARRKAYDASIFKPEPKPEPRPALSLAGRLEGAALGATPSRPIPQLKSPPRSIMAPRPRPDPRPQTRTAPSATALLHQPITPRIPERDPTPPKQEAVRPAEPVEKPQPRPVIDNPFRASAAEDFADHERHAPFQWKLPALAAGALVLAIGGGALVGVESGNDAPEDQLKPAVTLKVPQARAAEPVLAASALEVPDTSAERPAQPKRATPTTRAESARPPLQIDLPDEQPSELAALEQQQRDIEQAAATPTPAVAATSAKMPLPNAVIARTIGRIGYPCGQVASTAALDGAGVFKVTCTSGHSYRAAPVNGRYRFKRMGKS